MVFKKLLRLLKRSRTKENANAQSKEKARPEMEELEQRIMLSATWIDAAAA